MRILFSFIAGHGHFLPLTPLADAAIHLEHEILFVCSASMADAVKVYNYPMMTLDEASNKIPDRKPLKSVDIADEERHLRDKFVLQMGREKLLMMIPIIEHWQPDLIVFDEVDYGTLLAAEYTKTPYASVIVMAEGSFNRSEVVAEALDTLRYENNITTDTKHIVVSPIPARFRNPNYELPPNIIYMYATQPDYVSFLSSVFEGYDPHQPTIYFTLGTVFNTEAGDLFNRVLDGIEHTACNVIVTVGKYIDPIELGERPPNVYITNYLPTQKILPECNLVITHGGSGTVLASLAHGLPMLLLPMGADQPHNARRCVELGLAEQFDVLTVSSEVIHDVVLAMLESAHYRNNAREFQDEFRKMPSPNDALHKLQQFVTANQT
ncbi:MAG: glycosyltransferase [Chloroflexota bacterium]